VKGGDPVTTFYMAAFSVVLIAGGVGGSDGAAAAAFLLAIYCAGGVHGVYMAWSEPARWRHWAWRVEQLTERALAAQRGEDVAA
jgi:hypothetical protein